MKTAFIHLEQFDIPKLFDEQAAFRAMHKLGFDALRLGALTENLHLAEPIIREANLWSLDFAALRRSDSPGSICDFQWSVC